jgi:lipopolysaccharide export system permease protein
MPNYRPTTLQFYLLTQNIFLMMLCLGIGVCIYLLQDILDNLDGFLQAGAGAGVILRYFWAKLPLILSQILPAVYLLALIIQIGLLVRHRELLALQAGGISFSSLVRVFCIYGLFLCLLQLILAQGIAVFGQREMDRIWREEVIKDVRPVEVRNVWFLNGPYVVSLDRVDPKQGRGEGVLVYEYAQDNTLQRIILAETFNVRENGWELRSAMIYEPTTFKSFRQESLFLDITQDLEAFAILQTRFDPGTLSIWQLSRIISYLEGAGSNVERLRTAWHMKWAYAFSMFVMTLIALALATMFDKVYIKVAVGLGIVFVYHVLFVFGVSLGERGFLSPFIGAWLGNIIFGLLSGARLLWYFAPNDDLTAFKHAK